MSFDPPPGAPTVPTESHAREAARTSPHQTLGADWREETHDLKAPPGHTHICITLAPNAPTLLFDDIRVRELTPIKSGSN